MTARRLTRVAVVAALSALPLLAAAQPASAACTTQGDPETAGVYFCFVPRPSYLRCDVYVDGTLYDCKDVFELLK